jgi:hypothetical protein
MRMSGWARLAVVFTVVFWVYGVWEVMRRGSPPLWPAGALAAWTTLWSDWIYHHQSELIFAIARPVAILLGAFIILRTLVWVLRGFFPRSLTEEEAPEPELAPEPPEVK